MNYQVEVFRGIDGFGALEPKWRLLQQKLPDAQFFHYAGWYKSRLENVESQPDSVFFVYISLGGEPVAVFPLRYITLKRCGVELAACELYWPNDMGVCDSIFVKSGSNKALLKLLVGWLRDQGMGYWDVLRLPDTLEDSNILFSLKSMGGICSLSILHHYSKHIPCNADYEAVMGRVGGHFRRNVRRQAKKIKSLGDVHFKFVTAPDEMDDAYIKFLEVEASSWKGVEGSGTAVKLSEQSTRFYRGLINEFAADGACLIGLILVDGRCIAAQFSLIIGGTIHLLKIGYDDEFRSLGPGNVLLDELIRRYSEKVESISFITGASWNDCWAPMSTNVYENYVFNYTARGITVCVMERFKHIGRRLKWMLNNSKSKIPDEWRAKVLAVVNSCSGIIRQNNIKAKL